MSAETGISGQVMMVVGAASGIGRGVVGLLASRGARVVALDRDTDGCRRVASDETERGHQVWSHPIDVSEADTVEAAVSAVMDRCGRIHGLVNSAGVSGPTNRISHEVGPEEFDAVLAVNLRGAFLLSRAVLPRMVEAGYGRIVHLASIAGKDGNPGMIGYSTSKAGLIGLVKAQGKEYATTGVSVNAVAPAVVQTEFVRDLPQETIDYMTARIPMGRCAEVSEVAEIVAWAVSPACSFTTGFTFDASGGRATY